jgi:hypothetical protein
MRTTFLRVFALALVSTATVSCNGSDAGSARLRRVETGAARDSVLALLGRGPMSASGNDTLQLVNGYRSARYFINARSLEVLYVRDEPGAVNEPLSQAKETPIVLLDGTVVGKGWRYYRNEAMRDYGLPWPIATGEP